MKRDKFEMIFVDNFFLFIDNSVMENNYKFVLESFVCKLRYSYF